MSTIKSSSEDLTLNADGSNDIKFQSNGVEKASISSAGAFTSTTIDATKLTGEKRNFIIDGDFTQWPEGTSAITAVNGKYSHALTSWQTSNDGTWTGERSTDVPTVAQSEHSSAYSLLFKCTGTDASIGTSQLAAFKHSITGSDSTHLYQQQITISFWAKTAAANSGDTYWIQFASSTNDRHYVTSFSPTSSWTQFTHTLTMDTSGSGTWNTTEAGEGLRIHFLLAAGDTYDDATLETWGAGNEFYVNGSTMSNFLDSTSNEFYISQFQVVLGSVAPTFSSESVSTVQDQVDYYIQRWDQTSNKMYSGGLMVGTSLWEAPLMFRRRMRKVPTMSEATIGDFKIIDGVGTGTCTAVAEQALTIDFVLHRWTTTGGPWTTGRAGQLQANSTNDIYIMADARH